MVSPIEPFNSIPCTRFNRKLGWLRLPPPVEVVEGKSELECLCRPRMNSRPYSVITTFSIYFFIIIFSPYYTKLPINILNYELQAEELEPALGEFDDHCCKISCSTRSQPTWLQYQSWSIRSLQKLLVRPSNQKSLPILPKSALLWITYPTSETTYHHHRIPNTLPQCIT